jgi:putative DNA primase/helicase
MDLSSSILTGEEFVKLKLPPRQTYLHPWLTEQSISLITGWRGLGKTWFAIAIVDAITKGVSLGPWDCPISVPCLYLDGEMTSHDTKLRLLSLDNQKRKNPLLIYSGAYASYMGHPRPDLLDSNWRKSFKSQLLEQKIKVWVADNVASLTPGAKEGVKEDWDPVNQWLLDLRFSGIASILIHHEGKSGTQRGTTGREDNIDNSISLKKPANYRTEDGASFIVTFLKNRTNGEDIHLISDARCSFLSNGDGKIQSKWSKKSTDLSTRLTETIIDRLKSGHSQKSIVEEFGKSKQYVSRIKRENNIITKKKKKVAPKKGS